MLLIESYFFLFTSKMQLPSHFHCPLLNYYYFLNSKSFYWFEKEEKERSWLNILWIFKKNTCIPLHFIVFFHAIATQMWYTTLLDHVISSSAQWMVFMLPFPILWIFLLFLGIHILRHTCCPTKIKQQTQNSSLP